MNTGDVPKNPNRIETGKPIGFAHPVFKQAPGPVSECPHEDFDSVVVVNRLADQHPMVFMVDFKINCTHCGRPFRFVGMPGGLNFKKPMCSPDAVEAHLPIEPSSSLASSGL